MKNNILKVCAWVIGAICLIVLLKIPIDQQMKIEEEKKAAVIASINKDLDELDKLVEPQSYAQDKARELRIDVDQTTDIEDNKEVGAKVKQLIAEERKRIAEYKIDKQLAKAAAEKEAKRMAGGKVRKYKISKTEDSSVSGRIRYTVRVVVPKDIRAADVEPTAKAIIAELRDEDPEIDELALFLYKSEPAEGVYDVASVDWAPNGDWGSTTPAIANSNDRSSYSVYVQMVDTLP